jgi:hypothetical protein
MPQDSRRDVSQRDQAKVADHGDQRCAGRFQCDLTILAHSSVGFRYS